eukprot:1492209-Rhodomonas_salina.1
MLDARHPRSGSLDARSTLNARARAKASSMLAQACLTLAHALALARCLTLDAFARARWKIDT